MKKRKKQYSEEFKQDAVNYYYSSGKSMKDAADDLKISPSSLNNWIQSAKSNDGIVEHRGSGNYSSDAEKEIARLKKELRDKEDALDILKKAIGILNED
ncbi:transposase [Tissierella creatinophila]|uniref:Transposase n=1 Tax=Tissierella creatinophila DSM 6911 TaxID=1123403 RepID=A0A1U7M6P3_TISCR|nr:transposase [Tissierella creatinophila]OLS02993.1 transposase [Tissierella creatinophila DSM 6911]